MGECGHGHGNVFWALSGMRVRPSMHEALDFAARCSSSFVHFVVLKNRKPFLWYFSEVDLGLVLDEESL